MEREFLDVLDYELTVSEADLLDLHETLIPSRSSRRPAQLHPFFHTSALERAPRPQGGIQMFRTHRVDDEDEEDDDRETGSLSSGSFYLDEAPITPARYEAGSLDEETRVETESPVSSSLETPTSSDSSSEPSTAATSFSHHPRVLPKTVSAEDEDAVQSAISRAFWLAGHQLISGLPTAFPQIAVSV